MRSRPSSTTFFRVAVALAVIAVTVSLGSLALANWPSADDYCNRVMVGENGFSGAIRWLYTKWSGRLVTDVPLYLAVAVFDLPRLRWFSLLMAALFVLAAWQAARFVHHDDDRRFVLFAFTLSAFCIGLYPLIGQAVLWPTGGVVYMLPLVLTLYGLRSLQRLMLEPQARPSSAWNFAVGFAVGDSIELVLPIVAVYAAGAVFPRWKAAGANARRAIAWHLGGVVIGALVLVSAPGNFNRATATPGSFDFDPSHVAVSYAHMMAEIARTAPAMIAFIAALTVVAAFAHGMRSSATASGARLREMAWLALGALASMVPVLAVPPQFAPRNGLYMLVFGFIAALGAFTTASDSDRLRMPAISTLAVIALAGCVIAAVRFIGDARLAADIRVHQLARDAAIRSAANASDDLRIAPITLPVPPTLHYVDVGPDPQQWNNRCFAKYYGRRSVTLDRTLPMP